MSSKRFEQAVAKVDRNKAYTLEDSVTLLKDLPGAKFDETVELEFWQVERL